MVWVCVCELAHVFLGCWFPSVGCWVPVESVADEGGVSGVVSEGFGFG